jgi:aryl-alcohol dehydrogenase-like predicted oxidoreductase
MKEKLILGTVQFGLDYGINNTHGLPDESTVSSLLKEAYGNGITELDTAAAYGVAEHRIGLYHEANPKDTFLVNTKFSKDVAVDWFTSLKASIEAMKIETVHTIMFHSFEAYQQNKAILSEIYAQGYSRYFKKIGVSVYTNQELEALQSDDLISVVQLPFNMLDNANLRATILVALKDSGKEIHTRSCFLQGLFFKDSNALPAKLAPLRIYLNEIKSIADDNKIDIGHLALQYCLTKPYIDKVLIGVDSLDQLALNLKWSSVTIDTEILMAIDKIKVVDTELLNPSKW